MNSMGDVTVREKRQESHRKHNEKHNQPANHAYEHSQGIKMHLIFIKIVDKLLTSSKRTKDSEVDSARMA